MSLQLVVKCDDCRREEPMTESTLRSWVVVRIAKLYTYKEEPLIAAISGQWCQGESRKFFCPECGAKWTAPVPTKAEIEKAVKDGERGAKDLAAQLKPKEDESGQKLY